jgi:hypothetical protein
MNFCMVVANDENPLTDFEPIVSLELFARAMLIPLFLVNGRETL